MLSSCFLSLCPPSQPYSPLLEGRANLSAWKRQPELILHELTGLPTWPFPNAQGVLNHFLLLISALPLETHQQLCNLHFICSVFWPFRYICGRRMGRLGNCVVTDFRITQRHPESLSLENHEARVPRASLKTWAFKIGFCFILICD